MPLGIRPTVDFVFKLLFGSRGNEDLLISLLGAVLRPLVPITQVTILNPFNDKQFEEDKLSVVDVKAQDASGAWYVIEMQTSLPTGLRNRLAFYASDLYIRQLNEGHSYGELSPAITICFLTKPLFPEVSSGLLQFSLYDPLRRVHFGDQLQVHTVELPKYNLAETDLQQADWLERWVYFLVESECREAGELRRLLPSAPFQKATEILEMVARSPTLRPFYDDRAKAELDRYSFEKDARREARTEGRAEGRAEGLGEGRAEGVLMGRIEVLQRVLDVAKTDQAKLSAMTHSELAELAYRLERQLASRG